MKIMSFNTQHCLNFIEQTVDYELMANTITELGADIVGLNEMFNGGRYCEQTKKLSELTGLKYCYFAKAIDDSEGEYGNGLLSRYPIAEAERVIIPDPNPKRYPGGYYETRCLLKARLENGYTVIITHFGLNRDEQENAVSAVLENIESEKCILMGDFNVSPDDSVLLPIREQMTDTASLFDKELLSWPSDKPRMKIDYIFISRDLEALFADIPPIVASDHRPHIAIIKEN